MFFHYSLSVGLVHVSLKSRHSPYGYVAYWSLGCEKQIERAQALTPKEAVIGVRALLRQKIMDESVRLCVPSTEVLRLENEALDLFHKLLRDLRSGKITPPTVEEMKLESQQAMEEFP